MAESYNKKDAGLWIRPYAGRARPSESVQRIRRIFELQRRIREKLAAKPGARWQAERNAAIEQRAQLVRKIYGVSRKIEDPENMQCVFRLLREWRTLNVALLDFDEQQRVIERAYDHENDHSNIVPLFTHLRRTGIGLRRPANAKHGGPGGDQQSQQG
jgi:hypothetical protein